MLTMLIRNWWIIALRGAAAIIFGILAFLWPGLTLLTLIIFFGAYALVDGAFAMIAGIVTLGRREKWWGNLLSGLAGIVIGLITLSRPDITGLVLLYFIAAWAVLTGIFSIVAGIQLRRDITNEWVIILSGVLSVIFGVLLVIFPGAGALSLLWIIASYAILFGILLIILAFRLRGLPRNAPYAA